MSLLFEDTRVYASVLATKMSDNTTTPIKNAVISASVRDSGVSDGIMAGMLNGLGARGHRFRNYAANLEKYPPGLPIANIGIALNDYSMGYVDESPIEGSFYPIVNFRKDGVFLKKELDEERYLYTKKLLKRVAIKLSNIVDSIEEERTDPDTGEIIPDNPVDQLDDCYFLFGIDLYSKEEQSAVYMYHFWKMIEGIALIDETAHTADKDWFLANPDGANSLRSNAIHILDTNGLYDYDVDIQFSYVISDSYPGTLTDAEGKEIDGAMDIELGEIQEFPIQNAEGSVIRTIYLDTSALKIKTQGEAGVINEVTVVGLTHETIVHAYGTATRVARSIQSGTRGVLTVPTYDTYYGRIPGDVDFGRSAFYFPLHTETLEILKTNPEELVLTDAMMIIMHAAETVELKWYQQGWFKIVMVIIIAAIIYFSMGRLFKEGMTLIETITELAVQLGLSFIVDLLVKNIGGEIGLILAVAVAAYAASRGDFTKAEALLPNAKEILIATHAVSSATNAKIRADVNELQDEIKDFDQSVEDRKDEIHEIASMLADPTAEITLLDLIYENKNSYSADSTPDEWLQRVKGMKNAAPIVKENVSRYHSRMKELPNALRDNTLSIA